MYKLEKHSIGYQKRRKVLKKYVKNEDIYEKSIRGKYTVTGYRKYAGGLEEVDVNFEGEIWCRWRHKLDWHSVEKVLKAGASKIKVNRMIRRGLYPRLSSNLLYFSVRLEHYSSIKKLTVN